MTRFPTDTTAAPSRHDAHRMFDRIAHRYDLLNRLLSSRQDVAWRKRLARLLPDRPKLRVLDLATGTGDVLLSLYSNSGRVRSGVGVDMAGKMLAIGHEKIAARDLTTSLRMVRGDAMMIAFDDASFDAVTIAFGIRNVLDVSEAFREMRRVLRLGGRTL